MLLSGLSQYVGASIAVGLFVAASGIAVGWGRIFFAALFLLAWRRPWRYPDKRNALAFGIALGGMNILFYLAIARIPIGTAVALEFLGPVILASTARTKRSTISVVLVAVGVFLISWMGLDLAEREVALGFFFALAAGLCWIAYMLLGKKVATADKGIDGLAVAMAGAAIIYSPLALPELISIRPDGGFWLTLVFVAVLSSAVPYVIDQFVLRNIPATTFAILNSILPAMSTVVAFVMLRQLPTTGELLGLLSISIAVFVASYRPTARTISRRADHHPRNSGDSEI